MGLICHVLAKQKLFVLILFLFETYIGEEDTQNRQRLG